MTTLQQALHIFRKDARFLRFELIGGLLLMLVFVLSGVQTWEGLQEHGGPWGHDDDTPFAVFLPLAWSLLIARVIQTEALPGDRQFWLTRPYSRTGLVLGKLLFIATFVNLPFLLAQAAIVAFDGLPLLSTLGGLLWTQVLLTTLLLVPVTAIATLTRNLGQFLPAATLVTALIVAVVEEGKRPDFAWVSVSLGLALATAIGGFVIWRQYRLRRSGNTAVIAFAAAFASLVLCASFPDQAAFAIQSKVIGGPDTQFALKLGTPEPKVATKGPAKTPNKYRQALKLPISVVGTDPGNLLVQPSELTFKTLSGMTRRARTRVDVTPAGLVQLVNVDREFFNAAKNSPVTVKAEYVLTQLGNTASADVPLDGTPVLVPGLGQCGAAAQWDRRQFFCRSPFQRPGLFVSDRISPERDWYFPFPWEAHIQPVFTMGYELAESVAKELAPAEPERPAKVTVRERVAYFRYTLQQPNVRLADFAIDDVDEEQ